MENSTKSNTELKYDQNLGQYTSVPISNEGTDTTIRGYSFNNDSHDVSIMLDNGVQQLVINPQAIIYLKIDDTLSRWYISGELVTEFHFDVIENGSKVIKDNQTTNNFVFRNDGFDFLKIKIKATDPVKQDVDGFSYSDLPQHDLEINIWASIYDIQDLHLDPISDTVSSLVRYKKFFFKDYRHQKMSTTIAEYSTALSEKNINVPSTSLDSARALPTGEIISELIQSLDIDAALKKTAYEVNNLASDDSDESGWDRGGTNLFVTAAAQQTVAELLDYVLDRHVSCINAQVDTSVNVSNTGGALYQTSNNLSTGVINDICILSISRGPAYGDYGYFTLKPLSTYFKQAGKEQTGKLLYEHLFLQTLQGDGNSPATTGYLSPASQTGSGKILNNISIEGRNVIKNYKFVDVSPDTNSNTLVSRPICSYNFSEGVYTINIESNTVEIARNFISTQYISHLHTGAGEDVDKFLINFNKDKTQKRNIQLVSSVYSGQPMQQFEGVHHIIYNCVFQNTCINFDIIGQTYRVPGTFISIDRPSGSDITSTFDTRFCGQWFVIKVIHHFTQAQYYNNITAVRVHRYTKTSVPLNDSF